MDLLLSSTYRLDQNGYQNLITGLKYIDTTSYHKNFNINEVPDEYADLIELCENTKIYHDYSKPLLLFELTVILECDRVELELDYATFFHLIRETKVKTFFLFLNNEENRDFEKSSEFQDDLDLNENFKIIFLRNRKQFALMDKRDEKKKFVTLDETIYNKLVDLFDIINAKINFIDLGEINYICAVYLNHIQDKIDNFDNEVKKEVLGNYDKFVQLLKDDNCKDSNYVGRFYNLHQGSDEYLLNENYLNLILSEIIYFYNKQCLKLLSY